MVGFFIALLLLISFTLCLLPLSVDVCDENPSENKIEEIVNELDPKDFIIPQGNCMYYWQL